MSSSTNLAPSPSTVTSSSGSVTPALASATQVKVAMSSNEASSSPSPGPGVVGSLTSKEWIIPPRPKPGRKPATDTPPTKRKAQNRAAQRAFRERRAARVGELEEQIKIVEEKRDAFEQELQGKISRLTEELESAQRDLSWWRDRCRALEQDLILIQKRNQRTGTASDTVPINLRRKTDSSKGDETLAVEQKATYESSSSALPDLAATGCDSCSTTHCQCIEDAIHATSYSDTGDKSDLTEKTATDSVVKNDNTEQMEIDFTSSFTASKTNNTTVSEDVRITSSNPAERCGFCGDGTACICAEMANQENSSRRDNTYEQNRLAPIQNYSQFTPPASDTDAREVTLPSISQATATNPCANGPGTCAQCRADPRSTLFCKTLAAARNASGSSGGCCGGNGTDSGCCESRPGLCPSLLPPVPSTHLTLTCADAYTTLSRHPNFSQASDELNAWLPQLQTVPIAREPSFSDRIGSSIAGRPAMEVEAASVMGVLRYFDRRFASK